jgi:hypothetical protein
MPLKGCEESKAYKAYKESRESMECTESTGSRSSNSPASFDDEARRVLIESS